VAKKSHSRIIASCESIKHQLTLTKVGNSQEKKAWAFHQTLSEGALKTRRKGAEGPKMDIALAVCIIKNNTEQG